MAEKLKRLEYLMELVFPAVSEASAETQHKMADNFNRTHHILEFSPGCYIMTRDQLSEGKLAPKYQGPYKVMERAENGAYTLLDATNQKLERNCAPVELKIVMQALDGRNDESYEVEAILCHELMAEGMRYTVKWNEYDSSHNSQLEYDNFDPDLIIRRHWKRLNQQNPHAKQRRKREFRKKRYDNRRHSRNQSQKMRSFDQKLTFLKLDCRGHYRLWQLDSCDLPVQTSDFYEKVAVCCRSTLKFAQVVAERIRQRKELLALSPCDALLLRRAASKLTATTISPDKRKIVYIDPRYLEF
ncbi:hypothetical protein BGZ54_004023 [Gamsiella multidivaricata]|nr:hypothetical protein BGZ54_004023 [Gamsiella multidivaricata]